MFMGKEGEGPLHIQPSIATQASSSLFLAEIPKQVVFNLSCYNWHRRMKTLLGLSLLPKPQSMAYLLPWKQLLEKAAFLLLFKQV